MEEAGQWKHEAEYSIEKYREQHWEVKIIN